MDWSVDPSMRAPGLQVHYVNKQELVASRGLSILHSVDGGDSWSRCGAVPTTWFYRLINRITPLRRLFREGISSIIPTERSSGEWLIVSRRRIWVLNQSEATIKPLWDIAHGRRPLRTGFCIVDDHVYVGDYWGNPDRQSVCVHSISLDTGQEDVAVEFPAGRTRHVHLVQCDPITGLLWVGAGDSDAESFLGTWCPRTGQWTTVLDGSQAYRAVSLQYTQQAIYWGTDNHLGENHIYRLDRPAGKAVCIGDVVGPVYYSVQSSKGMLFATTVEKGEGQQDPFGRIYRVGFDDTVSLEQEIPADRWPRKYFGYATMEFAVRSCDEDPVWITLHGYRGGLASFPLGEI